MVKDSLLYHERNRGSKLEYLSEKKTLREKNNSFLYLNDYCVDVGSHLSICLQSRGI